MTMRVLRSTLVALTAIAGACDFPTGLPRFETRMVIPLAVSEISVGQLLPPGVTVAGSTFLVTVAASTSSRTLGQMCGAPCLSMQGAQTAKPAFTDVLTLTSSLPADVLGGTLASGNAVVTVSHTFAYDPLRPPGSTQNGVLRLVVRSGGRVLATDSVLPPFTTAVTREVALAPGTVAGTLVSEVTLVSPAGGPVVIDNNARLTATATPTSVAASEAQVRVQNRLVSETVSVDMTELDDDLRDRVQRGTVIVDVANPLAVAGSFELRLNAPGVVDVRRTVQVGPGTTSIALELEQAEMRALFGRTVNLTLSGTANGTTTPVSLLPTHAIRLTPRLDLTLEFGG